LFRSNRGEQDGDKDAAEDVSPLDQISSSYDGCSFGDECSKKKKKKTFSPVVAQETDELGNNWTFRVRAIMRESETEVGIN